MTRNCVQRACRQGQLVPLLVLLEAEVATEGQIELAVRSKKLSEGVLRLTAGDEVDMECKVENAFPAPVFAWSGLEQERRVGREVGREAAMEGGEESPALSSGDLLSDHAGAVP